MVRPALTVPSALTDRAEFVETASALLNEHRLALVVGAGISQPFGLPKWEELIRRLYKGIPAARPRGVSLQGQAEYFRTDLCSNQADYLQRVKTALYTGADISMQSLHQNMTLAAIGSLALSSVRGKAASLISFNFDDLLERYFEDHGFVVESVAGEHTWAANADVSVLHPHGLLASRSGVTDTSDIVLDQLAFSRTVGRSELAWRQDILGIMRRHFCLFIGLSGEDPNLESILVEAHKQHAVAGGGGRFWGVRFTTAKGNSQAVRAARSWWMNRGIVEHYVSDWNSALPALLFDVCRRGAERARPH